MHALRCPTKYLIQGVVVDGKVVCRFIKVSTLADNLQSKKTYLIDKGKTSILTAQRRAMQYASAGI